MGENMLGSKTVIALAVLAVLIVFPLFPALTQAQNGAPASPQFADSVPLGDTIPVGTRITVENWQKYEQFMPDGMIALFQRGDYWKMPDDLDMEVGPTVIHPLPKTYLDATEKYGSQVKLVELPDGRLSLSGYPLSKSRGSSQGMEDPRQLLVSLHPPSVGRYLWNRMLCGQFRQHHLRCG